MFGGESSERGSGFSPRAYLEQVTTSPHSSNDSHSHREQSETTMEDMIADDAVWKKIQQNTFTRWTNEHLKKIQSNIQNLETDLEDGLRLIGLLQVLSGKSLPKYNKKPSFRSQKLENVSLALNFLEKDEGIRIVNIDSSDIYGKDEQKSRNEKDKGPTPKQRLLNWVQNKVPELGISNFTSDWKDGKTIGALVDSIAPGLCPDWPDWNSNEALQNASEAMTLADDWLNVRQLITPAEIINPNIDELSMMTYLSQYPNAKLKPGAPIRQRTDPNRVRCYGPGIEPSGNSAGTPVQFTIDTFAAGKGDVEVILENPNGQREPVDLRFNNDRNLTYTCFYTPSMEGHYTIKVLYGQQGHMLHVPRSPFHVTVEAPNGDASKVVIFGAGVAPEGVILSKQTYFDISAEHAGKGVPDVVILDPNGDKQSVPVKLRQIDENIWRCEYVSNFLGLHSVNVFFNREQVPNSPFPVHVSPVCDAKKVKVSGRGLRPKGVRVGDKTATFQIHTELAGEGNPQVKLIQPGGETIPINLKKLDGTTYEGNYVPQKTGRYVATITYGGQEILNSPFQIQVSPERVTGIKAYGPGLNGGIVNKPAKFVVETNGKSGALGFQIEGPSQSVIDCDDNGDMSCNVSYLPLVSGDYYVHILENEEDIENSPFYVKINPDTGLNPELVECKGNGIDSKTLPVNKPVEFTIDPRRAGSAPVNVQIVDSKGNEVRSDLKEKEGVYVCNYTPTQAGRQTIMVSHGGVVTKNSPYRAKIVSPPNPREVKVFGPGVEAGLYSTKPTHFVVDTRTAGDGDEGIALSIKDETGRSVPFQVQDNEDNTFTVEYIPNSAGNYTIEVLFNNVEIPQSPITVNVEPHVDLSKINIQGLEKIVTIARRQQFVVVWPDIKRIQKTSDAQLRLITPSGKEMELQEVYRRGNLTSPPSSTYSYTPFELGEYLLYGANSTPIRILCTPPLEPGRVRVHGDGLRGGVVSIPAKFIIDTREAGHGALGVTIIGPEEIPIHCLDNYDGTCVVSYLCKTPGTYTIKITFHETEVPGSPFCSTIRPKSMQIPPKGHHPCPSSGIFLDSPTEFIVEGVPKKEKLKCYVVNPLGQRYEAESTQGKLGVAIGFTPTEEGTHEVELTYDGIKLPGSPYKVNAAAGSDPTKVLAFGKGLEQAIVDVANVFTIETKGAGTGGLGLAIEGPTEALMTCKDNRDGSCTVEYIPGAVGLYDIAIKFGDVDIPGSPFKVPVIHSMSHNKVHAYGDGLDPKKVREGVPQTFLIDASEAGPAEMSCEIVGLKQPAVVDDKQNGIFEVKYLPPIGSAGDNLVCNLKYNGKDIVNTPLHLKVRPRCEPDQVKVYGDGISDKGVKASLPASFHIDTSNAGVGDVEVDVIGPDGQKRKVDIKEDGSGKFIASYLPDDLGIYKITVKFAGHPTQSPISVKAHPTGHAEKCRITEGREKRVTVGQENCITVECKNGGAGAVTCRITSDDGRENIDVEVEENAEDRSYSIYYKVKESGDYAMDIKFGGKSIDLGSYHFKADSDAKKTYQTYSSSRTTKITEQENFQIRIPELQRIPIPSSVGILTAEVKTPHGKIETAKIEQDGDDFVTVKYEPKVAGKHELFLCLNGQHIEGSPFHFNVDPLNNDSIIAYGPGLNHGICGEPCKFTVCTKGAKAGGGLQFSIEGNSKADIKCTDYKDGNVGVEYICTAPGEYNVSVKFGENHIKGSPFTANITGEGYPQNQFSVGNSSHVTFPGIVATDDLKSLETSIRTPSGREESCVLRKLSNGNLEITFTPHEVGEHEVSVRKAGSHLPGSPVKVIVSEFETTIIKEKIYKESSSVNNYNSGGGDRNSHHQFDAAGDSHVDVSASGKGLEEVRNGQKTEFFIDTTKAGCGHLAVTIDGPSKVAMDCTEVENGIYRVSWTPNALGTFIVSILFNGMDITSSPFKVPCTGKESAGKGISESSTVVVETTTYMKQEGYNKGLPNFTSDATKVTSKGLGLKKANLQKQNQFTVNASEAGSNILCVGMIGPNDQPCEELFIKHTGHQNYQVNYLCKQKGEYIIVIKWGNDNIPGSPFRVQAS